MPLYSIISYQYQEVFQGEMSMYYEEREIKEKNLTGENFSGDEFFEVAFEGCDFTESRFDEGDLEDCTFDNCDLSLVSFKG